MLCCYIISRGDRFHGHWTRCIIKNPELSKLRGQGKFWSRCLLFRIFSSTLETSLKCFSIIHKGKNRSFADSAVHLTEYEFSHQGVVRPAQELALFSLNVAVQQTYSIGRPGVGSWEGSQTNFGPGGGVVFGPPGGRQTSPVWGEVSKIFSKAAEGSQYFRFYIIK